MKLITAKNLSGAILISYLLAAPAAQADTRPQLSSLAGTAVLIASEADTLTATSPQEPAIADRHLTQKELRKRHQEARQDMLEIGRNILYPSY